MEHRDIKWFPLDRIDDLQQAISRMITHSSEVTARYGLCCALGLHGLRVSEISRALSKHFEPLNRSLYVLPYDPKGGTCRPLKHGVPRTVKLHPSLVDAIMYWRGQRELYRTNRWLLPNRRGNATKPQEISARGGELLIELGSMEDASTRFHMLRHTYAMRLLAETNDICLVSKQLGHSNIQTTMVYAHSLKEVPAECLVKIYAQASAVPVAGQQLMLFNPFDSPAQGTSATA